MMADECFVVGGFMSLLSDTEVLLFCLACEEVKASVLTGTCQSVDV